MRRVILVMATGTIPLRYAARLIKQTILRLLRSPRRLLILTCLAALVTVYLYINFNPTFFVKSRPWEDTVKCGVSDAGRRHLINMTHQVRQILDQMQIVHWLFYGSLWEIRRLKFPLMWGDAVDIGIFTNGAFTDKTWDEFLAPFVSAGFIVSGNKERLLFKGSMNFRKNPFKDLSIKVYTFYNCDGVVQRTGLESWLFYINYKMYHSFPASFLEPALPWVSFGSLDIHVPRGGLEILRYIYPKHWNRNVTFHCHVTKQLPNKHETTISSEY
ncbi:uncharacterized protein LOC144655996 [Oculina patagonica]